MDPTIRAARLPAVAFSLALGAVGCTVSPGVDAGGGGVSRFDESGAPASGAEPPRDRERRSGGGLPSDRVDVTGTIVPGAECPAMRGDDGQSYSLSGGGPVRVGERVRIVGETVMLSTCQFGTTVQVERLTRL